MEPSPSQPTFELIAHRDELAVCRLEPTALDLGWAEGRFFSVTRTPDEVSIVCAADCVPDGVQCEAPWRVLEVSGPLDFVMVGVLAQLGQALADSKVSVFVISTFDTDWLMVRAKDLGRAIWALESHGHVVTEPDPA